jgi:hypothetical protein
VGDARMAIRLAGVEFVHHRGVVNGPAPRLYAAESPARNPAAAAESLKPYDRTAQPQAPSFISGYKHYLRLITVIYVASRPMPPPRAATFRRCRV